MWCTYLTKLRPKNQSASCPLTNTHGQPWVNTWPCLGKKRLAVSTPSVQGLTPPVHLLTQTAAQTSASQQPEIFLLIHSIIHLAVHLNHVVDLLVSIKNKQCIRRSRIDSISNYLGGVFTRCCSLIFSNAVALAAITISGSKISFLVLTLFPLILC